MPKSPKICIIIVNWNSWQDVIECLASLLASEFQNFHIIVCDNASTDGSIDKIKEWASGGISIEAKNPNLAHLSAKYQSTLINITHIDAQKKYVQKDKDALITLIETGANLGFAGGNNVGLSYAKKTYADCQFFYLLNADTVVTPDALQKLYSRLKEPDCPGICGTILNYYYFPDRIQALNGSQFNKWLGLSKCIANGTTENTYSRSAIEKMTYFVSGASHAVSRNFLESIGMMEEKYFLYYEEADWAARNNGLFSIGFADQALVYHKEGGSIGSNSINTNKRSLLSDYYLVRSRIHFTRNNFPEALVTVTLFSLAKAAKSLLLGHLKRFQTILKALWDGYQTQ